MSGHSKWSTIKHKKAATDAKRGKVFTKIIKEITVAAREGGGDVDGNPRLRTAVAAAKAANMPNDNVSRAIKKGTGELPGVSYDEITYEGYGPGGVAILVEAVTDNKMRTTPEVRHMFSKVGGNLGDPGSVAWMFEKKGVIHIPAEGQSEGTLMEIVLEAGADDLEQDDLLFSVTTPPDCFIPVRDALEKAGIPMTEASLSMEPTNLLAVDGKKTQQCLNLLELLEDHDDVQNVYANIEMQDQ